ncbi:hypothetical protein [Vreelandella utahensis]|uniref:hypothetical protein n=1 Tax=Vreelandella halophila TaxID=86177 RepID=UPI001C4DE5F2|nr:hypothetical protein [Halomonas utahensis]
MKTTAPIIALLTLAMAGCQTSSQLTSSVTDSDGVTCGEIHQAFSAYEQDRQSAEAYQQLAQVLSPTAGSLASKGIGSANEYYEQIRLSTNLALATRGCSPVGQL